VANHHAAPNGHLAAALTRRLAIRGVLAVAALSLVCNIGALAVPLFNMQVFNRVLATRDTGTLGMLVMGLALCLVAFTVLDSLRALALEALAGKVTRRLSLPLLRAVAAGGRGAGAGSEALADLETLRGFIATPACTAPFDIMWAPVLLLALCFQHWGFAVLGALCCAILLVMNLLGDAVSRRQMLAANEASATALRRAADAVGAAEAVLALGMLPTLVARWEAGQRRAAGLVHRAMMRARAVSAATGALRLGMTAAMVGLGLVLALNGLASGGSMVAGNMILARLLLPFQQVAATRRSWTDALAAWRRVQAALDGPVPSRYAHALPAPAPRLVVERLVYLAPGGDRPLLRGVSFTAEPGESIGIIGPSSAGKSTLVRCMVGMIPPMAGGAYLDGTSTFLWEREDFARHVGYMPQGLTLLDETVADNIARMGAPDMAAVLAAAKQAGVHRAIAALPQGYATRIAGGTLSSGQRQRVALARALYSRPGLLVLDEPSAFLDQAGEVEVLALLDRLRAEGTTVLLVSHRPALLARVDKLLVLTEGAVSQFGPRAEVLQSLSAPRVRLVRADPAFVGAAS
jgi:ATP-binding cassette subfamily C protein